MKLHNTVSGVEIVEGLLPNAKKAFCDLRFPILINNVDFMKSATTDKDVCDIFTEGNQNLRETF